MISTVQYLIKLVPTDSEKDRIVKRLEDQKYFDSLVEILPVSEFKFVKDKLKNISVAGFRKGSIKHQQAVSRKVLKSLTTKKRESTSWELYQCAALGYVKKQIPEIVQVLNFQVNESDAESDVFKKIIGISKAFDITQENQKEFFDCILFPRLDFDETFSEADDDLAMVLRHSVDSRKFYEQQLERHIDEVESAINEKNVDERIDKKIKSEIGQLSKKFIEEETDKLAFDEIHTIRDEIDAQKEYLENKIKNIKNNDIKEIKKEFQGKFKDLEQKIPIDLSPLINELEKQYVKNEDFPEDKFILRDDIESLLNEIDAKSNGLDTYINNAIDNILSQKVHHLENLVSRKTDESSSTIHNKLPSNPRSPKNEIHEEVDFISLYFQRLREVDNYIEPVDAVCFHLLFKASEYFIIDDIKYYLLWLDALGWRNNHIDIVATPIWNSESYWYEGIKHLYEMPIEIPTSLAIYDYEIGLVEGYLFPILKFQSISSHDRNLSKLALISSNYFEQDTHERFYEFGNLLSCEEIDNNYDIKLNDKYEHRFNSTRMKSQVMKSGVSVETFKSWCVSIDSSKYEEEISTIDNIAKIIDIKIPEIIILRYLNFRDTLEYYLASEISDKLSIRSTIEPWITKKYGDEKFELFMQHHTHDYD